MLYVLSITHAFVSVRNLACMNLNECAFVHVCETWQRVYACMVTCVHLGKHARVCVHMCACVHARVCLAAARQLLLYGSNKAALPWRRVLFVFREAHT